MQPFISENESEHEDDSDISKFTIKKYLVVNAWKKYRYNHLNEQPTQQASKIYMNIFSEVLVKKIIECANINTSLKKSKNKNNFIDDEDSEAEVGSALLLNSVKSNSASQLFRLNNLNKYKKRKEKTNKDDYGYIPEEELNYVEDLLDSFIIPHDASNIEQINVSLALKCLPNKIQVHYFDRIELIDFKTIHLAMIAFQNDDQDEIFGFYGEKNKKVLFSLEKTANQIHGILKNIDGIGFMHLTYFKNGLPYLLKF